MSKGFTLLELIIALIIIAGLATLGIQQYQNMLWKGRFAEVYQNVGIIVRAEKMYYLMNGVYAKGDNPSPDRLLGATIPAGSTLIQQELGVSFPENSLFLYNVYPNVNDPNATRIYFGQMPYALAGGWCYYYNYVAKTWTPYGGGDPGPGCKYFTPPSSTYP